MTKLKKLYSNYVARSRIWQMCPLYDEAIIRKYLISLACYAMGISLTVASFVYDSEVSDD